MPPYRGNGGRGSGAGAAGTLSHKVNQHDSKLQDWFDEIANGTEELANGVGLVEHSFLDQGVHQKLSAEVQELAATDAKLELKRKATMNALRSMAAEMDAKAARGPGAAAANEPSAEKMNVEYFLEIMAGKVSSAMEGAEERALESKGYKDLVKKVMPPNGDDDDDDDIFVPTGGTQVSLKCPITSTTFIDPVKSKVCNHTYGKAAIEGHIKIGQRSGGTKCPVAGCSHKVTKADLVKDKEMERRLRINSSTQQTSPEQDAEEIDDDMPVGETCI